MVQTKQVCCCGARAWALGIGWYTSIVSGLTIVQNSFSLVMFCALPAEYSNKAISDHNFLRLPPKEDQNNSSELLNVLVGLLAILLIMSVINMVSGIILITGVKQEKAGRLMAFIISHAAMFFCFSVTSLIYLNLKSSVHVFVVLIIGFPVDIFFIWVVNVHRKEILAPRLVPVLDAVPLFAV